MDVRVGLQRKLSAEELMLWSCVLEKTLESPLDSKEIQPVHPKGDQSWVFLGRKVMTNLDSILKSRDITLPTKVCLVKAIVFSSSNVWM